jgi:hypothetical protein
MPPGIGFAVVRRESTKKLQKQRLNACTACIAATQQAIFRTATWNSIYGAKTVRVMPEPERSP